MDDPALLSTRPLEFTPTWSVAIVLTTFVVVSVLVERSIHRLGNWLHKMKRKPLYEALEKMKEELMLLGFISLLLSAASKVISGICIKSSLYEGNFLPCKHSSSKGTIGRKILQHIHSRTSGRHILNASLIENSCRPGYEPFVSFEVLEQLDRFIFVMAVTHVVYSCLIMLLASAKVYSWRAWEIEAHDATHDSLREITRKLTMRRQSTFVIHHTSGPWSSNRFFVWVVCFIRQFGQSVTRADYLTLRLGFITNHNLGKEFDFHKYMICSMEDEFKEIVGISAALWGFVISFMLFNVDGSNLYFWISFIPVTMVLIVGTKLQHVIATLALENAGLTGHSIGVNLKLRDGLFWFSKPEYLLWLIHFIVFQNAFELGTFFWFWWQFGYNSCFLRKHTLVYIRLSSGFASLFLCSYSTLPLYALVTQMGTNYKVSLIPLKIRESIHGWQKSAKRKLKHGKNDTSTSVGDGGGTMDANTNLDGVASVSLEALMQMDSDSISVNDDGTPSNSPTKRSVLSREVTGFYDQNGYRRSISEPDYI